LNRQHLEVHAGENRTLTLYARDASNVVKNLTGHTLSWRVGRGPFTFDSSPVFTKTGSIVSAAAGTFTVSITPSDTENLEGDYTHYGVATDGSGNVSAVVGGRFRVLPQVEA
jgi:hypothetical protein